MLFFKTKASEKKIGYQSLVNAALREYVHDHRAQKGQTVVWNGATSVLTAVKAGFCSTQLSYCISLPDC